MKAAYIQQTGPPECITYGELPIPELQDEQCLVRVTAAALNPIDTYIRAGANYWELPQPFVLGCDLAGIVEQVGPEATRYQVGDRVWATNQGLVGRQGTFAEFAAVDQRWLFPIPESVTDQAAAANALVGVTAHFGLFREAQLQTGQSIFVRGGTGGVGSMVVQMAKAAGARVITSGGSKEKVARCLELGADTAFDYHKIATRDAVADFAPDGVHIFWETLREPDFDEIVECLAEKGRAILMAGREARPPFPVGPFYVKGCSLHGFVMFRATPDEFQAAADDMNRWMQQGALNANIGQVFPLSQAAAAHRLQEEKTLEQKGTLAGKILVVPDGQSTSVCQ